MSIHDDILDTSRLDFTGDFDAQVEYLLSVVRLSRNQVEELSKLFNHLEASLQPAWKGCKIVPFGSIVTGLGIKTSDVDCYGALPQWVHMPPNKTVFKAKHTLERYPYNFTEITAIPMAKVPIVKFVHIPTGRAGDVNFTSPSGVHNSNLIAYLLHIDERALPLAIIIKYWSKVHNLTGTNLMPNYALTLLVIFYLQQINILPSVSLLQRSARERFIGNWNTAFDNTVPYVPDNDGTLYEILGGFFKYYSEFAFEKYTISPYLGYPLSREVFNTVTDLPEEFGLYTNNLAWNLCQPLNIKSKMCIQDPFEHNRNCAVAVFPKLDAKIVALFRKCAKIYVEGINKNFLKGILEKVNWEVPVPEFHHKRAAGIQKQKHKKGKKAKQAYVQSILRRITQKQEIQDVITKHNGQINSTLGINKA